MITQTSILDPRFHSQNRTEFVLPSNRPILSYLRLVDFGCEGVTQNLGDSTPAYLDSLGVMSLIKRVTLLSNNQQIDVINDVKRVMNFRNRIANPDDQADLNREKVATNLALVPTADGYARPSEDKAVTDKYRVNLGALFPSLATMDLVAFDMPRIVIEYETDKTKIFSTLEHSMPLTFSIREPKLIYEEVHNGGSMVNEFQKQTHRFLAYESERMSVPLVPGANRQTTSQRLRFADGKFVKDLNIQTEENELTLGNNSSYYSKLQHNEAIQLRVNNRQLLMFNGVSNPQQKLAYTYDSVGELTLYQGQQLFAPDDNDYAQNIGTLGFHSYLNIDILQRIENLQLEFSRDPNEGHNDALTLHVIGRVERVVAFKNNNLVLGYG